MQLQPFLPTLGNRPINIQTFENAPSLIEAKKEIQTIDILPLVFIFSWQLVQCCDR